LDGSRASQDGTRTVFNEYSNLVMLGADVLPGDGSEARDRMSVMACLAHELAHAKRFSKGYNRSTEMPEMLLEEASIEASFVPNLSPTDRRDLVEDARDQLTSWLKQTYSSGE
jgi:hypothetical protein